MFEKESCVSKSISISLIVRSKMRRRDFGLAEFDGLSFEEFQFKSLFHFRVFLKKGFCSREQAGSAVIERLSSRNILCYNSGFISVFANPLDQLNRFGTVFSVYLGRSHA